jgi:hypothetical protein
MLKGLEEKIKEVNVLTDFDETMIENQSHYTQIYIYLKTKNFYAIHFGSKLLWRLIKYKKTGDLSFFYSIFEGCPVEVLDKTVKKLKQNEEWNNLIEKLKPEKIGIVSRNNQRIILNYLTNLKEKPAEIIITAANVPETKDGFYTGRVKLNVKNENLIDFVKKKEYICSEEEKKILENYEDINFEKVTSGLYIFYKPKIFLGWTNKRQLELVK